MPLSVPSGLHTSALEANPAPPRRYYSHCHGTWGKAQLREVKSLARGHTACQTEQQDLHPYHETDTPVPGAPCAAMPTLYRDVPLGWGQGVETARQTRAFILQVAGAHSVH